MRIVLAFSNDSAADKVRLMLEGAGFEIDNVICRSGAELIRRMENYDDAVAVMGYKLPDMIADEIFESLPDGSKLVSIVKPERLHDIENEDIFIIPLPVSRQKLISSLEVFTGNVSSARGRAARDPEEARIIQQAKLLLRERFHMSEQQAHRFIQKRSMDTGAKFIDTARLILEI